MFLKMAKEHGKSTFNGLTMNLEQAAIAFNYACYEVSDELSVRKIMQKSC